MGAKHHVRDSRLETFRSAFAFAEAHGVSRAELTARLGLNPIRVNQWMAGRAVPQGARWTVINRAYRFMREHGKVPDVEWCESLVKSLAMVGQSPGSPHERPNPQPTQPVRSPRQPTPTQPTLAIVRAQPTAPPLDYAAIVRALPAEAQQAIAEGLPDDPLFKVSLARVGRGRCPHCGK